MKYKNLKFIFIIFIAIFLVSCRNKVDIQPAIIETGPVAQSGHSESGKENPIDKPQNPDVLSDDWNGISYLSKEIISYDRMFDVVTNNNSESNRIDYFLSNLNNACVFVTNNYYNYISRNEETINKLIEVVKTDYRLLNTDSEEIKNLFNDIRGITLITLYLEEYRITFCFLQSGEIVVLDAMCCISQKKYDKKLFDSFIQAAKDDYNASNNKKINLDLDSIDVSALSIEEVKGYDKLNFQDYTSDSFKYNFNYRLEVKLSSHLLITDFLSNCYVYDTDLIFSDPYDYIDYMIKYLKFDQFPNMTKEEGSWVTVSFDIGELSEEMINYILKLESLYWYIDSVSISDNHYYEVIKPGDNYLVVRGNMGYLYKIIASYDEFIQAIVDKVITVDFEYAPLLDELNEFGREYEDARKAFYEENIKKLDKYDSSYFENKFLYLYDERLGIHCDDIHFMINQQDDNIEFTRLLAAPLTEYEYTYLYFLELDKVDGINPHNYSINGVVEDYATVTFHKGDEVIEKEVLKGTVLRGSPYYGLDPLFKNKVREIVVEDDIDLYSYKTHNTYYILDYEYCYFFVEDHPELNREVAFEMCQELSLNDLKQILGLNIDNIYADAQLTQPYFNSTYNIVHLSAGRTYWATLTEEDPCIVNEINEKCDLETKDINSAGHMRYNKIEMGEDEICFLIRRVSYPKMGDIEYVLKEVVYYPNETVFVLERNYYNYAYSGKAFEAFYDVVTFKGTDELLANANTSNISFIIDDSMILEDRYIRTDGVKTIYNPETGPLNINVEYLELTEWFNITDVYEENKDKIVFDSCNGNYNLVNRYGRVDYNKSDLSFFKQYFGSNFKFSDYYIYVLEYYSNINVSIVEHYYTDMSCGSFVIDTINKNLNDIDYEEKISKHIEMLAVKKSDVDYFMPSGVPRIKITSTLSSTKAQITISYAVGGKEYGINDLSPYFDDVYKEGIIAVRQNETSEIIIEMSGFRPSRNKLLDYNGSTLSFLSKREVTNEKDINVSYIFKSYDYNKHIIYIDRCYHDTEGESIDMICYDLITMYGCGDSIFGSYGNDIPDDLKIVINDIR